jgi:hypothetical protein
MALAAIAEYAGIQKPFDVNSLSTGAVDQAFVSFGA